MASLYRCCFRVAALKNVPRSPTLIRIAGISTSKKDKDTTIRTPQLFENGLPEKFDARVTNKHWVSWGWDPNDREQDATFIHVFFFCLVTLMMVTGGYFIAYCPSSQMHDWAIREAYLEIRRRESAGLPHIDRNLVPEDQVELPSEEELGDMEIII